MTRTRGEGRSGSEKGQRVIEPAEDRRARRSRERAEDEAWAARCGPVIVRKIGDSS